MVSVREATPSDAAALIDHLKALAAEPGINIPLAPDEVTLTLEQEKTMLADIAASPRAIMLVALRVYGQPSETRSAIDGSGTCRRRSRQTV